MIWGLAPHQAESAVLSGAQPWPSMWGEFSLCWRPRARKRRGRLAVATAPGRACPAGRGPATCGVLMLGCGERPPEAPRSATRVRAFRGPRTAVGDAPWPRVPQRVFAGSPARPWAGEGRSGGPASSLEEERLGCRLPWAFSPCSPSTGAKLSLSLF